MEQTLAEQGVKQNKNKNKNVSGASLDRTHIQEGFFVCLCPDLIFICKTNKSFTECFAECPLVDDSLLGTIAI